MEESRRNILKTATQYLAKDMNVKEVLIKMPHVFTQGEEEKIRSMSTPLDECIMFLDILPKRGDKAYDVFKEALAKVSPHLISTLDQAGNIRFYFFSRGHGNESYNLIGSYCGPQFPIRSAHPF